MVCVTNEGDVTYSVTAGFTNHLQQHQGGMQTMWEEGHAGPLRHALTWLQGYLTLSVTVNAINIFTYRVLFYLK